MEINKTLTKSEITLTTLLKNYFYSLINIGGTKIDDKFTPPSKIGEYTLKRKLNTDRDIGDYIFYLYEDTSGKEFFAKGWTGDKRSDSSYLMLKNEALAYKTLSKFNTKDSKIAVPNYIAEYENENTFIMLIEFVNISSIASKTAKDQIDLYESAIKYLNNIYLNNTNITEKIFSRRTFFMYTALLPLITAKAIINNPKQWKLLINALAVYLINYMRKGQAIYTLSHRDLDLQHIIQDDEKYYLLDLESLAIAPDIHDYVNTLRTVWHNEKLRKLLIEHIQNKFENKPHFREQLVCLALENAIHHLSGNENSQELTTKCIGMIEYFLNYKKEKTLIYTLRKIVFVFLYELTKNLYKNQNNILCYHNVSIEKNRYSINRGNFIEQIKKIAKTNDFFSLQDIMANKANTKSISITFDDGFKDLLQIVPELSQQNIPVTLFVLSDPDNADRYELDNNSPLLSLDEVKQLSQLPNVTIGCHTATHKVLTTLSDEDLKKEIIDSKATLEKALNKPVEYFAYPKGIYNKHVIEFVKKAGYKAAFSVDPGSIEKNSNMWTLPRYIIDRTHELSEFPAVYSHSTGELKKVLNKFHIWERFLQ